MQTNDDRDLSASSVPLVIDVDGTLIKSDLLIESFFALLRTHPFKAISIALRFADNRPALKFHLAKAAPLSVGTIPFNEETLALAQEAVAAGRKVYLASAADASYVSAIADHIGIFSGVFASDGVTNLSGETKARILVEAFGENGFDYAGDCRKDLPVWRMAREAILVQPSERLETAAAEFKKPMRVIGKPAGIKAYARAMRMHQWVKNLLVFVPMLAAHSLSLGNICAALIAFFSFSFCASSVYLLNDLLDLPNDRLHPVKRRRMLASGGIPLTKAAMMIPGLLAAAWLLSFFLPAAFMGVLIIYYLLTLAYSLGLKQKAPLDVVILALLYGMRIVAGGALGIYLSDWLVALCAFEFLSLALLKRVSEVVGRMRDGHEDKSGRGYMISDLPTLAAMATASGYIAVLIMAFYIHSPDVLNFYTHPKWLWGICIALIYWISRLVLLTFRGGLDEDPILFALKDAPSRWCGLLCLLVIMVSL